MMALALTAGPQSRSPTHLIVVAVATLPWSILFAADATLDRLRDARLRVLVEWGLIRRFRALLAHR